MVAGNIKETLNLRGVEVESQDSVCAGGHKQVCHEFCRNRNSGLVFSVLAGIAEEGKNGGDALGGSSARGVNHNQKLHKAVV